MVGQTVHYCMVLTGVRAYPVVRSLILVRMLKNLLQSIRVLLQTSLMRKDCLMWSVSLSPCLQEFVECTVTEEQAIKMYAKALLEEAQVDVPHRCVDVHASVLTLLASNKCTKPCWKLHASVRRGTQWGKQKRFPWRTVHCDEWCCPWRHASGSEFYRGAGYVELAGRRTCVVQIWC